VRRRPPAHGPARGVASCRAAGPAQLRCLRRVS
jgi:hypothetical protein